MTMSPSCSVGLLQRGDELGAHVGLEDRPVHRRVDDETARSGLSTRSPATKLWVFQWPKGALERRCSPLSQRPRARVIFVLSLSKDGSRFVDEDQPMRLGPHLRLSFSLPRLARLTHVGPIAFGSPEGFFLKLRPLRISQRDNEAGSAFTPLAAFSSPASSGMLMSSFSATRRKMKTRCGSSLLCRQPPSALGASAPRARKAVIKLITNEGDTLKWAAAARRECPAWTKLTTRSRRSSE